MGSTTIRHQSNKKLIDQAKLIKERSQTSEHELFKSLKDGWQSNGQHH